jgi:hypothetical protein
MRFRPIPLPARPHKRESASRRKLPQVGSAVVSHEPTLQCAFHDQREMDSPCWKRPLRFRTPLAGDLFETVHCDITSQKLNFDAVIFASAWCPRFAPALR